MQILFAIFGLALLLGIGRAIAGWLRRRRYPDRFDPPPTDPRQDYGRTNLAKYNQSPDPTCRTRMTTRRSGTTDAGSLPQTSPATSRTAAPSTLLAFMSRSASFAAAKG